MTLKKTKSNKLFKILLASFGMAMAISVFHACRKIETTVSSSKDLTNKFFQTKGIINPSVQKVIDKVKKDNEKYHQVNALANNEGLAIWDKALVRTKSKSNAQQRTADGDNSSEIVIIPLVLEETDYVNSFLAAKISDTIEVKLFSGKDYDEFAFGEPSTEDMTADRLVGNIMLLDKEVFGYTKFQVLDGRLFTKPGDTVNAQPSSARLSSSNIGDPTFGCWGTAVEIWWNPNEDACNCDGDEYFHHWEYTFSGPDCNGTSGGVGGGFGFGGTGGGGSSGGGYTGGGGTGSGNNGVTPIDDADTPCDPSIADFQNDINLAAKFQELNSNAVTGLNYEKGYLVNDRGGNSYSSIQGSNWSPYIQINNLTTPINGLLHSHFSGGNSIFSPTDILYLAQVYLAGLAKDSTNLFFGMTSSYGSPYLIKVSNTSAFRAFALTYATSKDKMDAFDSKYNNPNQKGFATNDPNVNEVRFLQMLQKELGDGMKLYRSDNPNCNQWTKLSVDNFGNVKEKNCF